MAMRLFLFPTNSVRSPIRPVTNLGLWIVFDRSRFSRLGRVVTIENKILEAGDNEQKDDAIIPPLPAYFCQEAYLASDRQFAGQECASPEDWESIVMGERPIPF
jgi:hypothetical protein